MRHPPAALLFALFTVSGFTGLIYESLWSHYLKLFLGHAAYAQSFVLVIFMGGMALGAGAAARLSARIGNLLSAYALIEGLIGIIALLFHPLYVGAVGVSLDTIIPALGSPAAVQAWKLALCTALLLPQSVLLGMTFPTMSGAVIRRCPADAGGGSASGHHLAMLYFTNSIGAAAGALASAFWLLGRFGLPGTMQLSGVANLALAAAVMWLAREPEARPAAVQPVAAGAPADPMVRLLLAASALTGAASFVYEIAWVRMLALVLGSSFQAFELMLSAFITGLALGGLWIRNRIDRIGHPLRFAGIVQLSMGLAALATLLVYHFTFDWMVELLAMLGRNDRAWPLFNLCSHAIVFAVMLPATFFAGMTLPLFTHALMRRGHGERSIGQVYAANTLGAIAGVLVAVHLLLPQTGLKLSVTAGGLLDMLLGAALLGHASGQWRRRVGAAAAGFAVLVAAAVALGPALDPQRLSSGVFRGGLPHWPGVEVPYYRDGKTASVALRTQGSVASITTNGKPDAAIQLDSSLPPEGDEATMTLIPALPLLMRPGTRIVANIGFGSGLSTEVALAFDIERIDTIEIEPSMVEAARGFAPRVRNAFSDPRSQIQIEDARTFFARQPQRYDLILSEPSNPWVNGVASLFSTEFYREVKRHLAADGLFVQWLHLYEFNDRLLASVLAALGEHFSDYAMFDTVGRADVVIIAAPTGTVPKVGDIPAANARLRQMLARIGIATRRDLELRRIGSKRALAPLFALQRAPANSDFRPVLQLEAPRAFFSRSGAGAVVSLIDAPVPIEEMLSDPEPIFIEHPAAQALPSERVARQNTAWWLHDLMLAKPEQHFPQLEPDARLRLAGLKYGRPLCAEPVDPASIELLQWLAERTLPYLDEQRRRELWIEARWLGCDAAAIPAAVRERLALFRAIAARDARAMLDLGLADVVPSSTRTPAWRRFALLAAMLGAQVTGQSGVARDLWSQHAAVLFEGQRIPPYARYLSDWSRTPIPVQ